jgi:DNA modification methylase
MPDQQALNLASQKAVPVECLGQKFPSDEARREHYLKLLAEKLKDPEFRKIEGFPIGEDEDILALSDPPYYTACPNPWLGDFIRHYGRPYDPKEKFHREPFAADVSEGKNHPIYNAHSYPTKVPHRAIMRYILHYTQPGDVVLDGFCGTGMTGVASQLCGDTSEITSLGFSQNNKGNILNENGDPFSRVGARVVIMSDLSPAATFIAETYNTPFNAVEYERVANDILSQIDEECGWMYSTIHSASQEELGLAISSLKQCKSAADCRDLLKSTENLKKCIGKPSAKLSIGIVNYTVWSDVFSCPECGGEINFWQEGVDTSKGEVKDIIICPICTTELNKRALKRVKQSVLDNHLGKVKVFSKQEPVVKNFEISGKRVQTEINSFDLALIDKIYELNIDSELPVVELPDGYNTNQPRNSHGLTHVHHFFSLRNGAQISSFIRKIQNSKFKFLLTAVSSDVSKLARVKVGYYFKGGGGPFIPGLSGTLYVPSLSVEKRPVFALENRLKTAIRSLKLGCHGKTLISTGSSTLLASIGTSTIDYIFIDPPFGGNIMYSELNYICEALLKVFTKNTTEAIANAAQGKGLKEYHNLMLSCFKEFYRVLKPGRWMTVEFSNSQAAVWNTIQSSLQEAGFVVANVAALDKQQRSFKSVTSPTAVKQDLVISAYKPDGGLEERFHKTSHKIEAVWDFVKTHLGNLPVIKVRGGELEFITERDPRILHDRMIAFYIGHGVPVPLNSAEFQSGLAERFQEREGMVFLAEQVTEWDKKRAKMDSLGQMSIFVDDEKSAINWLRNFIKDRPSAYQDIQPEFMQQLGASWKKFETRPELQVLLHQNFLQYDGKGEVPSQIHAYLSTQFKELRKLSKDDRALQSKAKDRWYVPDPAKAIDVETIRNKRLLQEFWELCDEAGIKRPVAGNQAQQSLPNMAVSSPKISAGKKIKEVRTEAVRLGFKECFAARDYATILAISAKLPENVIEEDEQLQMIHDMAEMRSQG